MRRYNKYYYKACESYVSLRTEDIITRQLRSENIIQTNEVLIKIGGMLFFAALFWTTRLAFANALFLTSWSLYVIIFYFVMLLICSRIIRRRRAYSDAAEIMLQFQTEEDRLRYFDEKLRPQFD
ncbi:hypothetical protein J23TS9_53100 [Paenibacillus sp. J23TS9]|uniref:hypothetical protein n=1 Tax=Paenibacillus sp. J23TS9 TaxID=2807193 RepID=UPI001B17C243|nr:hypothetical protein [Paenibacillus sp. J23TS9]GIP30180.1 hypothetical protein J23TS9_53100 [Paenibacillus sp. J23TS9]